MFVHGRKRTSRANACTRANGTRWDEIHSSVVDARGDGPTDRPTVKIEIDRIERVSRLSLSLSRVFIDRFERRIHSFIHSRANIRCARTNERTKGQTKRRTNERARERRERRDDRRIRSHRATRGAHVSNARRIERIERIESNHASFILNDRPETITRKCTK